MININFLGHLILRKLQFQHVFRLCTSVPFHSVANKKYFVYWRMNCCHELVAIIFLVTFLWSTLYPIGIHHAKFQVSIYNTSIKIVILTISRTLAHFYPFWIKNFIWNVLRQHLHLIYNYVPNFKSLYPSVTKNSYF